MIQPSPMALGDKRARSGLASKSQRRGVTPLVLLLNRSGKISARSETTVVRSSREWISATPLVLWRADDRQVGHADALFRAFGDQADAREAARVAGEAGSDVVQEAAVDLVDDLEQPRDHDLEEADRPGLERLGHQRVVGVGQGAPGQVPGFVPARPAWSSKIRISSATASDGVGVVELDGDLVGKGVPVVAAAAEPADDVGQRAGDQEVLLDEPEVPAAGSGVVGVEDARQHLGGDFLVDGVEEIAAAELEEVEVFVRGGVPEPQRVDGLAAVADDRAIVGNADEHGRHVGDDGQPSLFHLEGAVEPDVDRLGRAERLPRGRRASSQLSGCSTCRPSLISWRNMPYS